VSKTDKFNYTEEQISLQKTAIQKSE